MSKWKTIKADKVTKTKNNKIKWRNSETGLIELAMSRECVEVYSQCFIVHLHVMYMSACHNLPCPLLVTIKLIVVIKNLVFFACDDTTNFIDKSQSMTIDWAIDWCCKKEAHHFGDWSSPQNRTIRFVFFIVSKSWVLPYQFNSYLYRTFLYNIFHKKRK